MSADTRITPLPTVRAALLSDPDMERRWLIEGLWTRAGVGFIGGMPKCCKSWLGLDLVVSVASGTACLDSFAVREPGGTLIYMAEDAASVVKERLLGLCRHRGLDLAALPIDVITAPSVRLDLEADRLRLAETVRQTRPRLLLLDPLVRCHRIDENDVGQVSELLAYLRGLQREHQVAVVVVHHARKNGSGDHAGQSLRGSGDFYAWIDSGLYLRRQRDHLVLSAEHRAAPAGPAIEIALAGTDGPSPHLALVAGESPTDHESLADTRLDAAVLRVLDRAAGAPMSRDSLRAVLRIRNAKLGGILTRLAASGTIVKCEGGWSRSVPDSPR